MSTPVEKLLKEEQVYFIPKGKDLLVHCMNPEHEDGNPSMRIDKITGMFGCFSCGFKGNIFTHFGAYRDFQTEQIIKVRQKIRDIVVSTVGREIPAGSVPIKGEVKGIPKEVLLEFEAFTSDSDFPGRVVFPIRDICKRIIGFNARLQYSDLTKEKYIVSPPEVDLPLYPAKAKPYFGSIILVEGLFDMINLAYKGLDNAVCCFGTRKLSHRTVKQKLQHYRVQGVTSIHILFDGDDAGRMAARDLKLAIDKYTDFVCEVVYLPDGKDPGELTTQEVKDLKKLMYDR